MAKYYVDLTDEVPVKRSVGVDRRLQFTFEDGSLICFWDGKIKNKIPAEIGDRIKFVSGEKATKMVPPKDSTLEIFWRKFFFRSERKKYLEGLIWSVVKKGTALDNIFGKSYFFRIYVSKDKTIAVSFDNSKDSRWGVPDQWFVEDGVPEEAINSFLSKFNNVLHFPIGHNPEDILWIETASGDFINCKNLLFPGELVEVLGKALR